MGVHLLAAVYLLFILESLAMECPPREYKIDNLCCPMCDKGSFVKAHCTPQIGSSVCVVCVEGTYTDHPNGLPECFRCKDCDTGAGLIVEKECTTSSNTVCKCKDGLYCVNKDCDFCQEHTQCKPGQYVKMAGTWQTDTVCEKCPEDHFSNETNSLKCSPWTKCADMRRIQYKQGTSVTDSICREKRRREAFIVSFVLFVIVMTTMMILFGGKKAIQCNRKQDQNKPPDAENSNQAPYSTEESGGNERT